MIVLIEKTLAGKANIDRRAALKARHRRAILVAARELILEQSAQRFSVDELSARADVAKRTIFNHFDSLEDVMITTCTEELSVVVQAIHEAAMKHRRDPGGSEPGRPAIEMSGGSEAFGGGSEPGGLKDSGAAAGGRGTEPGRPEAVRGTAAGTVQGDPRPAIFETIVEALRSTDVPAAISFIWRALGGLDTENPRHLQLVGVAFTRVEAELAGDMARCYPEADPLEITLLVSTLIHGVSVIADHWIHQTGTSLDADSRRMWDRLFDRLADNVRTGYGPRP